MTDRETATRERHRAVIAKGRPSCHICGQPIDYDLRWPDPGSFVVDHLIPLARGGADVLTNVAPAHNRCNREKSDKDHASIVRRSGTLA